MRYSQNGDKPLDDERVDENVGIYVGNRKENNVNVREYLVVCDTTVPPLCRMFTPLPPQTCTCLPLPAGEESPISAGPLDTHSAFGGILVEGPHAEGHTIYDGPLHLHFISHLVTTQSFVHLEIETMTWENSGVRNHITPSLSDVGDRLSYRRHSAKEKLREAHDPAPRRGKAPPPRPLGHDAIGRAPRRHTPLERPLSTRAPHCDYDISFDQVEISIPEERPSPR